MDVHISPEVLEGLHKAKTQALRRSSRLRVVVGEDFYPILRSWQGGFALAVDTVPFLRGTVEIHDGGKVLYECLIVCATVEGTELTYEYKRLTPAVTHPPVDFELPDNAPVALIAKVG